MIYIYIYKTLQARLNPYHTTHKNIQIQSGGKFSDIYIYIYIRHCKPDLTLTIPHIKTSKYRVGENSVIYIYIYKTLQARLNPYNTTHKNIQKQSGGKFSDIYI